MCACECDLGIKWNLFDLIDRFEFEREKWQSAAAGFKQSIDRSRSHNVAAAGEAGLSFARQAAYE